MLFSLPEFKVFGAFGIDLFALLMLLSLIRLGLMFMPLLKI